MPQDNVTGPKRPDLEDPSPPDEEGAVGADDDPRDTGGVDWQELEHRIRTQVVAHPFIAVGAAVATGYVVGRLFRR